MKRTMLDYSNSKKYIIDKYQDDVYMRASILVDCQQMIEALLKWGLVRRFGTYASIHSIQRLCKSFDNDLFKKYREFCYELTSLYYEERYDSDNYEEHDDEEYYEIVTKSLRFREEILKCIKLDDVEIRDLNNFKTKEDECYENN